MFGIGEAVTVVEGKSKRKGTVKSVNARCVHVTTRDGAVVFNRKSLTERGGGTKKLAAIGVKKP